jgi:hypothetical protein
MIRSLSDSFPSSLLSAVRAIISGHHNKQKGGITMAYKINTTIKDALKLAGGGIVGAGVALLLAPRTGKETRKEIVRFARTAGRKTDRAAHELGFTLAEFASTVGEKGRKQLDKQRHRLARRIG